ncbi:hypothetical protein [Microbacterium sp. CGR1]|uniref:hypothetical protein n=1 Tax=Microbacterium sp. CGR1 TaxID=1696072 RepID=UPI003DA67F94
MHSTANEEDAELRQRLRAIEVEHADLLANTMGLSSIGNPDLVGRAKELEQEADKLRVRLGEPAQNSPALSRFNAIIGWLMLGGAVAGIIALVILLPQ